MNELTDTLRKRFQELALRARGETDLANLKARERELMARLDAGIRTLGAAVYRSAEEGALSPEQTERWSGVLQKLEKIENGLKACRDQMLRLGAESGGDSAHCACGARIPPESQFCPECGEKATHHAGARVSCSACGEVASNPEARFCPGCGADIKKTEPSV